MVVDLLGTTKNKGDPNKIDTTEKENIPTSKKEQKLENREIATHLWERTICVFVLRNILQLQIYISTFCIGLCKLFSVSYFVCSKSDKAFSFSIVTRTWGDRHDVQPLLRRIIKLLG